ncbi:MAG: YaiI/YqxD family protein [Hyphomicrobiaceae bacterium]|nr:YaiI/YqxD family protein [Hyphomicrobiaceae bacterium]
MSQPTDLPAADPASPPAAAAPEQSPAPSPPGLRILVDADACPVKDETYRVALRHGVPTVIVANSGINIPRDPLIERVVVPAGPDVADDWIAGRATAATVVVTADVPLAARCVKAGATVIAPNGKTFTEQGIGMALATRNLLDQLRSEGEITGGPPPFAPRDRSRFLATLDTAIVRLKRASHRR